MLKKLVFLFDMCQNKPSVTWPKPRGLAVFHLKHLNHQTCLLK